VIKSFVVGDVQWITFPCYEE